LRIMVEEIISHEETGNQMPDIAHIRHLYREAFGKMPISASMHPTDGDYVGITEFLRQAFSHTLLIDYFGALPRQDNLRILVVPGCIGCEAASFAMLAKEKGLYGKHDRIDIHALDISEKFTTIAESGCYPEAVVEDVRKKQACYSLDLTRYFNHLVQEEPQPGE